LLLAVPVAVEVAEILSLPNQPATTIQQMELLQQVEMAPLPRLDTTVAVAEVVVAAHMVVPVEVFPGHPASTPASAVTAVAT
jgi:hypothetical protein